MSQLIIGLTGGIASGKTTVSNQFIEYGVDVVDADIVAREIVAPGSFALQEISSKFGYHVLLPNGELNRRTLRDIIFNDESDKKWLNELLHPLIRQEITTQLAHCTSDYCLLVAPLLIENNMLSLVNRVLVVDVDEQTQIQRTMTRDKCSNAQANAIVASQISRSKRLNAADDVIKNTGMINRLTNDVKTLHDKYTKIAKDGS